MEDMWTLTRTIMAWLLILAIPAQGYAAVAMVFCDSGLHSAVAQQMDGAAVNPMPMSMDSASEPAERVATESAALLKMRSMAYPDKGKCNVCVACYVGVVLLGGSSGLAIQPMPSVLVAPPMQQ